MELINMQKSQPVRLTEEGARITPSLAGQALTLRNVDGLAYVYHKGVLKLNFSMKIANKYVRFTQEEK